MRGTPWSGSEPNYALAALLTIALTAATCLMALGLAYDNSLCLISGGALVFLGLFWRDLRQFSPTPVGLYILFSVVFYSHRYLFKWGDPESQTFRERAPDWLRASKDLVWLFFVGYCFVVALRNREQLKLDRPFWPAAALALYVVSSAISFGFNGTFNTEDVLFYFRYPLEYVPAILIPALFINTQEKVEEHGRTCYALCFVVLGFLVYEAATGAENGFNWGGETKRYGSIFGSPLDLGMFCTFVAVFTLSLWDHIRIPQWKKRMFLASIIVALVLTVSFGAFFSLAFALCLMLLVNRGAWKFFVIVAATVVLLLIVPNLETTIYLSKRSLSIREGTDMSTEDRLHFNRQLTSVAANMEGAEWFVGVRNPLAVGRENTLGTLRTNPIESYYARLFVWRGLLGVFSLLGILVVFMKRFLDRWRNAQEGQIRQVYSACTVILVTFFVSLAAHPRLDMFPTNFYFWLICGIPFVKFEDEPRRLTN